MSPIRILTIGATLLLAALFLTSCKSDYQASQRQGQRADTRTPRKVKTTNVVETPFGETVTANGTLAAYDQTTVSVKVPGRVQTISVDLGTVVARGQVIAQLDPEDYRAVVRAYQAAAATALQPYDGYIAQYLGDGLLVYFGWPQAHEDAAQRAVHASLALLDALGPLHATHLIPHYGVRIAVRIGLHTGLAVIGAHP